MAELDGSSRPLSFLTSAVGVPALPSGFGNRPALTARMTAAITLPGPGVALVPMPSGEVTIMTVSQPLPGGVVKDDVLVAQGAERALDGVEGGTGWMAVGPDRQHAGDGLCSARCQSG